jgi:[protein-PII] uridylyltransferase
MPSIAKPREIIDRKNLVAKLDEIVEWSGYTPKTQGQILDIFKNTQKTGWNEVRRRFEEDDAPAEDVIQANAYLVDQLVRTIHEFALTRVYPSANPTMGEQMSLVATGGYGRGELAPFSDVDIMFLLPYKLTAHSEQVVEFTLYMLWDLGLKVGHATRSVDEALRLAREDLTIRTSLLEARWLWGNPDLFQDFKARFSAEVVAPSGPEFVEAKLAERDNRHDRMGDTRYVLEPNVKEGKGGLRDLQTLFWIAKYLYQVESIKDLVSAGVLTKEDVRQFAKVSKFLWTVRCHLHYQAGRPEERLIFAIQDDMGKSMGYRDRSGSRGVERFMKHYFLTAKNVGDLTRTLCSVLEEQHKKRRAPAWLSSFHFRKKSIEGFALDSGRLSVKSGDDFTDDPVKLLQLFQLAQKHKLDVHPNALRLITQNLRLVNAKLRKDPSANGLFIDILTGEEPDQALTRLNEAGVLGRFVPDFGRVVAQMQYDMYHVYTVDEHTIRAIGILNGIETMRLQDDHPVACSVIGEVQSRRALYLGVLLHDIAKGRGGDHSELGAKVATKLGPRFGFNDWETETVAWLVRHHLLMSNTAFKRDIEDPKTVSDFVEVVQSPERLRLLLILTVADIRAVGPNVWNEWKAGLLRELYWRSQEALSGGAAQGKRAERVERAKARLRDRLSDWPEQDVSAHIERGQNSYWLSVDMESQARHAELIRDAEAAGKGFEVAIRAEPERDVSEITVYAPDHPGLFAAIAGAMALSGASVVDAKIQTLTSGMALDSFWAQDISGGAFGAGRDFERFRKRVEDAIQGKLNPRKELEKAQKSALPSRTRAFSVPPRVLIDNKASQNYTVIEINGKDRPGLLYELTASLTANGLQISSAHISTYGERVVDVFYVKDVFGLKMMNDTKIETTRKALLKVVGGAANGKSTKKVKSSTKSPGKPIAKSPTKSKSTASPTSSG